MLFLRIVNWSCARDCILTAIALDLGSHFDRLHDKFKLSNRIQLSM